MVRIRISLLTDHVFLSNLGHIKFQFWVGHDFNTQGKISLGSDAICPSSKHD